METLKRGGWVYVLHHPADSALALEIKMGLNRLGHQIWVRERDAPDQNEVRAHDMGIERAAFVVVLETRALKGWLFAHELIEWVEVCPIRPQFIRVAVERDCSISSGFLVKMRARPRRLVAEIEEAIQALQKRPRAVRPPGAPEGDRDRYVLLSYASTDADKAVSIRKCLNEAGIAVWDYAVSPRQPTMGYEVEIPAAIEKATAILFVLTAAWLNSSYCRTEYEHANSHDRNRLWLRFGPGLPPEQVVLEDLVEFRGPNGRAKGLIHLARLLQSATR